MRTATIVSVVLIAWMTLLPTPVLSQCPELTKPEVTSLTLVQAKADGTEGAGLTSVVINEFNINCLAAASTRGYLEASVTVNYTTNTGTTRTSQLVIACSGSDWSSVQSIALPRTVGGMTLTEELMLNAETELNCLRCSAAHSPTVPSFCQGPVKPISLVVLFPFRFHFGDV